MGNQLAGIAPSQIFPVEYYLTDLPDITYDISLGSTRFFKVARAKHKEGLVVAKVFAIHDLSLPLKTHGERLEEIRSLLTNVLNCLPFQKVLVTERAGILMRQYVKDNLYDRISTRPFLNGIEKRWIAFQLFCALDHCHSLGVCHGDIKLENIMVTGWNWVLLTDFASFKPTYLPEDNPADFSYFFDTSRRRTCYVAPERFVKTINPEAVHNSLVLAEEEIKKGDLTPAMDIFSLGCALTELFTEGHSPFDFSQLLAYCSGEYSPWKVLEKIDDVCIRELIRHMIQKDPTKRFSAKAYLEHQKGKGFPECFYTFLREYMEGFASSPILTPDNKISRLRRDISTIITAFTSIAKSQGEEEFAVNEGKLPENPSNGLIVIVSLVTSCLRSLKHCTAKLHAIEVLKEMAPYLSSEIILDRLLPYLLFLVSDKFPRVKVAAIQTLTHCLTLVETVPRSDANIFPEYILPILAQITQDEAVIVRVSYAENIASIANTALRFLEITQLDPPGQDPGSESGDGQSYQCQGSYDNELKALHEMIQQSVSTLLSDPENIVKQSLLECGIIRLCVFFGRQKANDVLLSHMITFLNDKEDRHLRGAFFDNIVGVAAYVGWHCSPILKPLLQQGLADSEEQVIYKTLNALADLAQLRLLQKQMLFELVAETVPLLCHPNLWIRQGTVGFVCSVAQSLELADIQCKLLPLLNPVLEHPVIQVYQEVVLLNALTDPLPRTMFDYLVRLPLLPSLLESLNERQLMRAIVRVGHPPAYGEVDSSLTTVYRRLQSDGMTENTEDKIMFMKDHLLKIQKIKSSTSDLRMSLDKDQGGIIDIESVKVHVNKFCLITYEAEDPNDAHIHSNISRKSVKKKMVGESPSVNMNEEWQCMFGTMEPKNPSPTVQTTTGDSATSQGVPPPDVAEDSMQAFQNNPPASDGNIQQQQQPSFLLDRMSNQYECVPCRQEVQNFLKKKALEYRKERVKRAPSESMHREMKSHMPKWRPQATIVAHLHEHRGAVNRLQVIHDTTLFATCSNDGTVKVWDCGRMEGRSVANRSRQTYTRMDGPVSCLAVCQGHQALACAADTGTIQVFRIEHNSPRSSMICARNLDPQEEGYVVDMTHFDTDSQLVLSYATCYGSIVGWDLRSPGTAWKMDNDPRHGLITSFCVDPNQCWLVVGTASGKLVCWDLRFQLPITTISHPTGARVRRLLLHPFHQSTVMSAVQGNNEVSLWDLETSARVKTLWASTAPPLSQTQASSHSTYCMCAVPFDSNFGLLTAGSDMRIRFWDMNYPAESCIVVGAANDPHSAITVSYQPRLIDGTEVIQELYSKQENQSSEGPPRRYPEPPSPSHHDCISDLATLHTSQSFLLSASYDGVVKVWK